MISRPPDPESRRPRGALKQQRPSRFGRISDGAKLVLRRAALFGACLLVVNTLVGEDGLVESMEAEREYQQLVQDVDRLKAENERLREQAERLRHDPSAIEEVAREELGLIAPDERVFLLNDDPPRPR